MCMRGCSFSYLDPPTFTNHAQPPKLSLGLSAASRARLASLCLCKAMCLLLLNMQNLHGAEPCLLCVLGLYLLVQVGLRLLAQLQAPGAVHVCQQVVIGAEVHLRACREQRASARRCTANPGSLQPRRQPGVPACEH